MALINYLFVIPSTCQMYSGTGTAIYDWIKFSKSKFRFTVVIDTCNIESYLHVKEFCRNNDVEFVASEAINFPGCPDVAVVGCAALLATRKFEVVELVSWANAATNTFILSCLPDDVFLIYTPHTQPLWTIGDYGYTACINNAFRRVIVRANLVLIDSHPEIKLDLFEGLDHANVYVVPLGVDTSKYCIEGSKDPRLLLTVGDFREKRKRPDLLLECFTEAVQLNPQIRIIFIGRGSESLLVPKIIESNTCVLGYISDDKLLGYYRQCAIYVQLSDFEAFGLPIAESLCCGMQAVISHQEATYSLFADLPGVRVVDNRNAEACALAIVEAVKWGCSHAEQIAEEASARFGFEATYGKKMALIESGLSRMRGQ